MSRQQQSAVINGHLNSLSSDGNHRTKVLMSSTGNGHPLVEQHIRQEPRNLQLSGCVRPSPQKPRISIEEADRPCSPLSPPKSPPYDRLASPTETFEESLIGDTRSVSSSPYKASGCGQEPSMAKKPSPQHLMVKKTNLKSNSLPLGMSINAVEAGHISSHSPTDSDYSDEVESSPTKSAIQNGTEHPNVSHKKRTGTVDSLYSESDSGSSSEDEKMGPILQTIPDDPFDDVFHDVEIDMGSEVDSKLIDWAFNVFVPACCTLLSRCAKMEVQKYHKDSTPPGQGESAGIPSLSDFIQSDLRSLSNTINYFCCEQQRLSGLIKAKISSSVSTDRMSKIAIDRALTLQTRQTSSNTSSFSDASSGSVGSRDSQTDRSYAVKILRSVSQSLIAPLLHEAEDGFTDELYKSIVQALQKISWKVEACLSFNDPCKEFEIHAKIFDSERASSIKGMMIGAVPPEEPKLQVVAAAHASRSNSISSPKENPTSGPSLKYIESSKVIRRTPSGRERPSGAVFDSGTLPDSLLNQGISGGESPHAGKKEDGDEGKKAPVVPGSSDSTPSTPHRTRTATTSELELSPSHKIRFSARTRFSKSIDQDDFDEDGIGPQYLRPKAARRTTISLSRKEVTNLGLTVAKRVEESIIPEVTGSKFESNESGLHDSPTVLTEDDIRRRLHESLMVNFNREYETMRYFERVRSASMSDLLEDNFDNPSPPRRHDSFQGLEAGKRTNSGNNINGSMVTLDSIDDDISISSARIEQAYVPAPYHPASSSIDTSCEAEWVYINRPSAATMARQSSVQSEPGTPKKKDKRNKHKRKSVDKVPKRSLAGSGKFTDKLMKTAQALRRASVVTKPKKIERKRINSVDLLSETGSGRVQLSPHMKTRSKHSRSEPPSPIPPKYPPSHSNTAPSSSKHKSLKRFLTKKSKSFNSKDSLGRKIRGKSEFLQDYGESEMERECRLSFTESIENYSKNAVKPRVRDGKLKCPCMYAGCHIIIQ